MSPHLERTMSVAQRLGTCLTGGDLLALTGDLGSGKTHFVKGLAQAWQIPPEIVSSPTFTLIHEYPTDSGLTLLHADVYRLSNPQDFWLLGLEGFIHEDVITVIEWADRVREMLPPDVLWIHLELLGAEQRLLKAYSTGPRSCVILDHWKQTLSSLPD
ncbi:MAG: hypothetical protein KatS3mg113_0276 [Planctomycetaceae bacterium]|nr:MAG: hypothetical protein KatS3mg113_0276 [Planctomycetaceae bacterium]